MDEIINYGSGGLMAIGYIWITAKSSQWFFSQVFKKAFTRKEKDRKQAAVNELYDAYDLGSIKPYGDVKIAMKGGLVILIYRQSEE